MSLLSRRAFFSKSLSVCPKSNECSGPEVGRGVHTYERNDVLPLSEVDIALRISAEPAYRNLLNKFLVFCSEPRTSSDVRSWMLPFPEMQSRFHSPEVLMDWMVQVGGIAACTGSDKECLWQTTEKGHEVIRSSDPVQHLHRLIEQEPEYRDVYKSILEFCMIPRSSKQIEAHVCQAECKAGTPTVYPSYWMDRLETNCGIEWTGKWQTTQAGKIVYQEYYQVHNDLPEMAQSIEEECECCKIS